MNVEGKRYVGGDFPVHLLTMGKLFNKRLVPCAFGIKIGLYFQTLTARKPLIYRGLRAFLYALLRLCNAPPTTENSPFCSSFSGGTLEGHCDYLEGYTPKIALADATFEAKFKCV